MGSDRSATPFSVKLLSGAVGGVAGTCVIFPIDVLKTQQQQTSKSLYDCLKRSLRTTGWRALYSGLLPNLIGVVPEKAIKLSVNAYFRQLFSNKTNGKVSLWGEVTAGGLAGLLQVIATAPMERIKIRHQINGAKGESWNQTMRGLGGIRGLYKGTGATLARDIPFSVLFFTMTGKGKEYLADDKGKVTTTQSLSVGLFSGIVAAVLSTPCDVVKTRIQAPDCAQNPNQYTSVLSTAAKIAREEGIGAFFKGAGPRALIVGPLFGIAIMSYDLCERLYWYLQERTEENLSTKSSLTSSPAKSFIDQE